MIFICLAILGSIITINVIPLFYSPIEPDSSENEEPAEYDLQNSISKAIKFLDNSSDPHSLLWLDVIHRRFGVETFSDSLQLYDQKLKETVNQIQISQLRLFRRIADYNNTITFLDLNSVVGDVDPITVPALYCDRIDLPENYKETFVDAVNKGDYLLTHALLAWIWIQENDCNFELPEEFINKIYQDTAALINNDQKVDDLELEAAAFLFLARQEILVDISFINQVLASQNIDGSWGEPDTSWHSTTLGLLLLLHKQYPAENYPPILAFP